MQICLCSALGVADMNLGIVFFLDTCNSFSSNRIASMINQHTATSVEEVIILPFYTSLQKSVPLTSYGIDNFVY